MSEADRLTQPWPAPSSGKGGRVRPYLDPPVVCISISTALWLRDVLRD